MKMEQNTNLVHWHTIFLGDDVKTVLKRAKNDLKQYYIVPFSNFLYTIDADHRDGTETSFIEIVTSKMTVKIKLDNLFRDDALFNILFP